MHPNAAIYNPLLRVPSDESERAGAWGEACNIAAHIREISPGAKVLAFGSLVRSGAWTPRSDIDIAVSGMADYSHRLTGRIQDKFQRFEVQVVCADRRDKEIPQTTQFLNEVISTGVEIPAPMPSASPLNELLVLAARLGQVIGYADIELAKMLASKFKVKASEGEENAELVRASVCYTATRYRRRLERGLSRILGFIDRLPIELDEGEEVVRLYTATAVDIPGLRPAAITPAIAAWHAANIENEFALLDSDAEADMVKRHLDELPAIHEETRLAFERFSAFLSEAADSQHN